ncbi:MAG: 4-hydroxy-tetrahydrodipicolinate synthase [Bacilli bacterium]|nr:4-hydroxy-tetrahydrodipicolinate synthase [Bacilli bacterium]
MKIFEGSGVALVTPFDKDGNVDYETFKRLIDFQIENGTDSIIVCGTTGESSTLTYEEHQKCIETCIKHVNGRVPVIAGTGSNCTKSAIKMSKEAENLGADGLLLVTPYYNKTTQKGLINHYTKIAKSVDTPIILYNVPSRTGCNLEPETIKEIANNNENVVGVKEASGNISNIAKIIDLTHGEISVYSGNDDQIVPILSLGGVGVISVIANILPKETHDLVRNYLDGNIEASREEQIKMLKLCKALFKEVNPIPIKKALELMGMCNGTLREPLIEMETENQKQLIKEMKDYGIKF